MNRRDSSVPVKERLVPAVGFLPLAVSTHVEEFGMAAHAICRASHRGIGFATVELNDIRQVFATAIPQRGCTLREQTEDALQSLDVVLRAEGSRRSIIQQTVFLAEPSQIDECRQIIRDFYGADLPATSYIPQPPCGGTLLLIEAHGVGRGKSEVEIERVSEQLVVLRHDGMTWGYCTPLVPRAWTTPKACITCTKYGTHCTPVVPRTSTAGAYESAANTLHLICSLLHGGGVRFDQVIRTWLYLGGIVAAEGPTQRYKELNRARADFYKDIPFVAGYQRETRRDPIFPASTGIGTEGRELTASAIALATDRDDIIATPLENPRQTSAYDYARSYSLQSPKFSRAMALSYGPDNIMFISGTASITHSESRHVGDVVAQTHESLDNIEALISEDNLDRHGLPGFGSSLEGLGIVRVYVKRKEDYPRIQAVCAQRLGEVPTIYVTADVCRPELLVEIEGIAFSRRGPSPSSSVLRGPHFREIAPKPKISARPA